MIGTINAGHLIKDRSSRSTFTGHAHQVRVAEDAVLLQSLHRRWTVVLLGQQFQGTPFGQRLGFAEFSWKGVEIEEIIILFITMRSNCSAFSTHYPLLLGINE